MSPTVGTSLAHLTLTSRCPIRNCKVEGFEYASGMAMGTPLGTYIEDNDQMHIPPYAVGDLEPFKGGDLVTLKPCGHTFREMPPEIEAEFRNLRAALAAERERTRPPTRAEMLAAVLAVETGDGSEKYRHGRDTMRDDIAMALERLFESREMR